MGPELTEELILYAMGFICLAPVTFTVEDQTCLSDLAVDIRKAGQHLAGVSI